jgi:NAD(P)-dependent dehydrogenase (short-subunit alcohol dehydrogenase family)
MTQALHIRLRSRQQKSELCDLKAPSLRIEVKEDAMAKALVIGASGGIGAAVAAQLEAQGDDVIRLSRSTHGLDVTNPESVDTHLGALKDQFDLVFVAIGVLSGDHGPEKSLRTLTADELKNVFMINAVGPALILKHASKLMPRDRPTIVATLSARVGSIGDNRLGGWYSYRASKAALNQLIKSASIELARTHKHLACVALHPGTVQTPFTQNYSQHASVPSAEAAKNILNVLDTISSEQTGKFFDWSGAEVPW